MTYRGTNHSGFDEEELFYLAIEQIEEGGREEALSLLKRSIAIQPTAQALYMLGAEYAELKMYERAIACIREALESGPGLDTARLQLGFLYLTTDQLDDALGEFQLLSELDESYYLFHFGNGMIKVLQGDVVGGIEALELGIQLNADNAALNRDITAVLSVLATVSGQNANDDATPFDGDLLDHPDIEDYLNSNRKGLTGPESTKFIDDIGRSAENPGAIQNPKREYETIAVDHLLLSKYRKNND
jgi:tetratricopeptide (TPR) repeat protein